MKKLIASLVLLPCIFLAVACTPSNTVVISLQAVVAAAEEYAALSSGADIAPYINQVAMATTESITELQTSDTPSQKALKITNYFAEAAVPDLSALTPQEKAIVLSVEAAVKALLVSIEPGTQPSAAKTVDANASAFRLTHGDKHTLSSLKRRAAVLSSKCADALNSRN